MRVQLRLSFNSSKPHFFFSLQILPQETAVFIYHVSMPAFFFWNGYRPWIHINIICMLYTFWNMSMTTKQDISLMKRRKIFLMEMVSVCCINQSSFICYHTVICHNRKFQYHLIHFRITVSSHTDNILFVCV